jgi:ComF family protein
MQLLHGVVGAATTFLHAFDLALFPPHCLITGEPITGPSPLPLISQAGLDRCNPAPDPIDLLLTAQRHLQADNLAFSSVTALWALSPDAPIHNVIMAIKYGGHKRLAIELGIFLGGYLEPGIRHPDRVIAFVPVHPARRRERGYDQAELVATGVARKTGSPLHPLLQRTRYTGTQTALSDADRARNVAGVFIANSEQMRKLREGAQVSGLRVLLIDDVFTTGATVNEAATALLEAGVRRVDVATLCATE